MGPLEFVVFSQEDNVADHWGHIIAKCSTDPHGPDMAVSAVVSAAYIAINITDDDNFATFLDQQSKLT